MSTLAAHRTENIEASILKALEADSALVAVVPTTRWVTEAGDFDTKAMADWIEPRVSIVTAQPSRKSGQALVTFEVGIAVRPGTDIFRRKQIGDLILAALSNAEITVTDHGAGDPVTEKGRLRFYDGQYVQGGRVEGIYRASVTIDGRYFPS